MKEIWGRFGRNSGQRQPPARRCVCEPAHRRRSRTRQECIGKQIGLRRGCRHPRDTLQEQGAEAHSHIPTAKMLPPHTVCHI
eukprot:1241345-Prymnesium_polylepis.1